MGTWTTRGLRGSTLEEMINRTNEKYREKKLALVQKIPTPITPIHINKETSQITLAYFEQKKRTLMQKIDTEGTMSDEQKAEIIETAKEYLELWQTAGK
jgi:hypothetical protein